MSSLSTLLSNFAQHLTAEALLNNHALQNERFSSTLVALCIPSLSTAAADAASCNTDNCHTRNDANLDPDFHDSILTTTTIGILGFLSSYFRPRFRSSEEILLATACFLRMRRMSLDPV